MAFQDKTLTCKECGKEFIFTAGEQEFYAEKGFCAECGKETEVPFEPKNDRPVYCRDCFSKRKAQH